MSIYSNNRSGSMELDQVTANESYTCNDFGRILYESQLNDMAFFEAILTCDFKEAKGLQEGTILQSEVKAINEASFKEIKDKLIERLKAFWAKIQGVFKSAIDKISAYALGDGKAFVREFDKAVEKRIGDISKWDGSVNITFINTTNYIFDYDANSFKFLADIWKQNADLTPSDVIFIALNRHTVKEFPNYAFETAKTTDTITKSNIDKYLFGLEIAKKYIKELRDSEKKVRDSINEAINSIKAADNVEADRLSKMVSTFETVATVLSRTKFAAVKYNIRSARKALTAALATMKVDDTKNESTYIDDIDLAFID